MTLPTLRGDKVAQKMAEDALGSKPEASYCVGVGAFDLSINLSATGQGYREHRLGAKKGREWNWQLLS